jgi:hypothetical protein
VTDTDPAQEADAQTSGNSIDEQAGAESESEAGSLSPDALRQAFVTGSDWTAATVLQQLRNGNIDLNPRFQRREVWQPDRKSRFIESLLMGLPVPQVVLAEAPGQRGRFIVLDGKQRLLTLRQFCADPASHSEDTGYSQLSLRGLHMRKDLNGKSYIELRDEPGLADDRDAFDNNTIRTVVVRNWPSNDYLFLVFLRLNTESVALSPQELRQALQPGRFTDYLDERAIESLALQTALNQSGPDFRMRDTEVLLRAVAFALRADSYAGNLKQFLDETCAILNRDWVAESAGVSDAVDRIEGATATALEVFGPRVAFSRYTDGHPERRFNRAVYDVMVHSLGQPKVATAAKRRPDVVKAAYMGICEADPRFVASITSTTKSIPATAYRFASWADALGGALGVKVSVPADYRKRATSYKPA